MAIVREHTGLGTERPAAVAMWVGEVAKLTRHRMRALFDGCMRGRTLKRRDARRRA
jgi:hypothetical protein